MIIAVGYAVLRWREHHGHSPAWGDVPTWLTFVAAAFGIPFALYQFDLQRRQLREQQTEFEKARTRQDIQDKLLSVQLQQAEASLRVLKRQQAESISVKLKYSSASAQNIPEPRWAALAKNESRRPITDITARISPLPLGASTFRADGAGRPLNNPDNVAFASEVSDSAGKVHTLKPGDEVEFEFSREAEIFTPRPSIYIEFTDDAGNRWRLDDAMSLREA